MVLVLVAWVGRAEAIERNCPAGQTWSPSQGACVKKAVVRKRSPAEAYYLAIDTLEGKGGAKADPARAATLLAGACAARHAPSCALLGFLHQNGRLGAADPRRALELYQQACALDDADSCISVSSVHARGLLGAPDPAAAIAPLAKACDLGSGAGCVGLAEKYDQALGVERDPEKAKALYTRAHERLGAECPKSGQSCFQLGLLFAFGNGVAVDHKRAGQVFVTGCEAGSGAACYAVGYMLQRGLGAPADADAALPYFIRACDQYDNADGCVEAGTILTNGGSTDAARLTALAERACRLSTAQCSLQAFLFATGRGGTRDQAQATETYLRACQAGNALACSAAAGRIAHGEGVAADGALATQIWERACETGSGEDCFLAGLAHRDGELVKADAARAFALFSTGCVRKSASACEAAGDQLLDGQDGTGKAQPDRALELYGAGCALSAQICTRLGDVHRTGEGVPADAARALAAYVRGCEAGDGAGCAAAARLYLGDATRKPDLPSAFAAHARACQLGEGASCFTLEPLAAEAQANAETRAKAVALLQAACDDGKRRVEDACQALGLAYAGDGALVARDPRRAFALINDSCARDYPSSCLVLANFLTVGVGVVANKAAARERYTTLCDRDLPEACWQLGNLLVDEKAFTEAAALFSRACEEGLAASCNNLGFQLYTGQGVTWNVGEAAAAYQKACDLGDGYGCANIGELTEHGIGVAPDDAKAAALYERACDAQQVAGCPRLGVFFEEGRGGKPVDRKRARELYRRSCDGGSPDGCRALAVLGERDGEPRSEVAKVALRAYDLARAQAETNPYYAFVVGTFHRDGLTVPRSAKEARVWFDRACEGRDPLGCMAAGEAHLGERDATAAVAMFDRACAAGVDRACQRATEAKRSVPMSGRGCGCRGGGDAGLGLAILLLGLCGRRRRAAH